MFTKMFVLIGLSCLCLRVNAQQLCLEERKQDDAIIKDLFIKDGLYYLTVDVVQIVYDNEGAESIKNENPKLRTFLIDPNTNGIFVVLNRK